MNTIVYFQKAKEKMNMMNELIEKLKTKEITVRNIREAEDLADKVLGCFGYKDLSGPTPIVKIAQDFGFESFKKSYIGQDNSGDIYVGEQVKEKFGINFDKIIIVDSNEELFHQRFIAAHELGHYFIDYLFGGLYKENKLFSETYKKDQDHSLLKEQLADRFAAELLMPGNRFVDEYNRAYRDSLNNRRYIIKYLSEYFQTKKTSIERRIEELGL